MQCSRLVSGHATDSEGKVVLRGRTVRCAKSWLFSTTRSLVSSED